MILLKKNKQNTNSNIRIMRKLLMLGFLLMIFSTVMTQPPFTFAATTTQGLIFGTFFRGNIGGTVIINPDGTRSVTGDLVQSTLGVPFSPAIFEITAKKGSIVTILNGSTIKLHGNNGGTASLKLGASIPPSPIIITAKNNEQTTIRIGGTLTVSGPLTTPSGSYSGNFYITFIQQ
jgi:hypothetical protein